MRRPRVEATELDLDLGGRELLSALPAEQRRAVAARVLQDKAYAQIAAEQAVSAEVAGKRVSRGLGTLRARLKEDR